MDTAVFLHDLKNAGNYQSLYERRLLSYCFGYPVQHLMIWIQTPHKDPKTDLKSERSKLSTTISPVTQKLKVCQLRFKKNIFQIEAKM